MSATVPTAAQIEMPKWFWGGTPADFFGKAGLHGRLDRSSGKWHVSTQERYFQRRPDLVRVLQIAGGKTAPRFDLASQIAVRHFHERPLDQIPESFESLKARAERTGNLTHVLNFLLAQTSVVNPDQLAEAVRCAHESLRELSVEGDSSRHLFDAASVHIVERSAELGLRTRMPAVLLRTAYDERLNSDDPTVAQQALSSGQLVFSSANRLYAGLANFAQYLGPLLGCLSPHIWCFAASRGLGAVAYGLGCAALGTEPEAAELLQLLPTHSFGSSVVRPQLSSVSCDEAIDWWGRRLNLLFGVLSNPCIFTDRGGVYLPVKQLQSLLTVEQLFDRVSSIQASHRDGHARRVLLFTVLDTVYRVNGRDIERLCNLDHANKVLSKIESDVPERVGEVLLPAARRAVLALKQLQDGFFMAGDDPKYVRIERASEPAESMQRVDAAAEYVKLLRDATHGHGSNRSQLVARREALLVHHNGHISDDLPLLGYLYLLEMMCNPEMLAKFLYGGGR